MSASGRSQSSSSPAPCSSSSSCLHSIRRGSTEKKLRMFLCLIVLLSVCSFIPICRSVVQKLKKKLLWNFVIRLIVEGCLELFVCSLLGLMDGNVFTYDNDDWGAGELFNFISACVFGSLVILSLPLILCFYCSQTDETLEDESF